MRPVTIICCILLASLTLLTTVEFVRATGQWNFAIITQQISQLVKEWLAMEKGGVFLALKGHQRTEAEVKKIVDGLRGLAEELGQAPTDYGQISGKLAKLEKYAKDDVKIVDLIKAIRVQFVLAIPFDQFANIERKLVNAKTMLEEEGKKCRQSAEFGERFSELMDQMKGGSAIGKGIRDKYGEFTGKYLPTLLPISPQYLHGFRTAFDNFKPEWVPEEELTEIEEKMGKQQNGAAKGALKRLYDFRQAINQLVKETTTKVNARIQQFVKANSADKTLENAAKYEHVRVYTAYTAVLPKLRQTLYKIASFGPISSKDVAEHLDGRKLMAMACLLHQHWLLPFSERVAGLEAQQKTGQIAIREMLAVEDAVKTQSEQLLSLFKKLDVRAQMCANVAKSSHDGGEGKEAEVEAWMELVNMPKARDIPGTASGDYGLVYYQMYLDRL